MSIWLQVTVTSEQRTSFGTGGERAYLTHTHPFLPGSVLRGALAAAWLKDAASDADFELIFERGRFGPALPQGVDVEPQSVGKCKYHRDPSHAEYIDFAFEADPEAAKKAKCAARENLKGNFTRKNLVTRAATAIEPRKNTAAQSQLFSREMIEKGTTFVGHVVLPDKAADARLAQLERAFFGGRGSILGRCRVSWKQIQTLPGTEQLKAAQRVVIRTLSPTILVDDAGLPSTDLRAAIKEIAGTDPSSVWADRVESGLAGGWHSASGMPKPSEIAIAPGAVAVLDSVDPDQVRRLLDHGLGVRRNEGYGWVEVVPEAWQPASRYSSDSDARAGSPCCAHRPSRRMVGEGQRPGSERHAEAVVRQSAATHSSRQRRERPCRNGHRRPGLPHSGSTRGKYGAQPDRGGRVAGRHPERHPPERCQ